MKNKVRFLILAMAATLFSGIGSSAQNLIEGFNRVFYADDLKDGKAYFLISDRTKYAGNKTNLPKGMAYKLDKFTITWDNPSSNIYFVYWGDFDAEEEGFQWIAEDMGDGKWAFKNKVKEQYLGVKNSYDDDVLFSANPVAYTLTDLDDGQGRFFMTSSENTHSPHVQGYLRSDRPNNSLAKQNVGDDNYVDDVATYGYPGRWQIYEVESTPDSPWITDVSQIKEGDEYYIISDRTKYAGNSDETPKAMSSLQDSYTINWGAEFVYWGNLEEDAPGFIWIAEKVGDEGQWAFLNKENGNYLGVKNTADDDVLFSTDPVGYTLTDLSEGQGRFFMTSSENTHSPHVQGYLRSDRPNNSLAKQNVGDDNYVDDVATYGYPGRWKLYRVSGAQPTPTYSIKPGYYNIVSANTEFTDKVGWIQQQIDESSVSTPHADLAFATLTKDPRMVFWIEPVEGEEGKYVFRNYISNQSVGEVRDGLVLMSDTAVYQQVKLVEGTRNTIYIYNETCGENFMYANGNIRIACDDQWADVLPSAQWKLQSVSQSDLDAINDYKKSLATTIATKENPTFFKYDDLTDEQQEALKNVWNKADYDVHNGTYEIIYQQHLQNLGLAFAGQYQEPVYNKYQQDTVRVLSYNVQHCAKGIQKVADAILAQRPTVVALQELDSAWSRSNYKYEVQELAAATGMYGLFCSALEGYGIGMLSWEMPKAIHVVALTSDFEPRRMLVAEFDNYVFASLHVGLSANARRGTGPIIKEEADRWVELGKPLIIAGDFNDDGTDDEMQGARGVLTQYLQENGFTYHSDLKTPTWSAGIYVIDNIISYDLIGGVETISYEVVNDKTTSDHMPILGELLVGFEDPNAVGGVKVDTTTPDTARGSQGKVYTIDGAVVARSADGITQLPEGIYIFDGKKLKK